MPGLAVAVSARRWRLHWWFALSLLVAACSFDPAVPESVSVTCSAENPVCPNGRRCVVTLGLCVAADSPDREAPGIVSAALPQVPLRAGQNARIVLQVSEPLGAPPSARLTQGSSSRLVSVTQQSELQYTLQETIGPTDLDGPANISIDLTDLAGNAALGVLVGALTVDQTPPALLGATIVSPQTSGEGVLRVRSDVPMTVRLVFSEAVAQVDLVGSGACGTTAPFVQTANRGGIVDFEARPPLGRSGCTAVLTVDRALDLAGNEASHLSSTAQFQVDDEAPVVSSLELGRRAVGGFESASRFSRQPGFNAVAVQFSVAADAQRFTARLDTSDFPQCELSRCQPADDGGLRHCACEIEVSPSAREGGHTVTITAEDEAQNQTSLSAAATFDFVGPQVVPGTAQVSITAPAGCPLNAISAAAPGSAVTVSLSFEERATATLSSSPVALAFPSSPTLASAATFVTAVGANPGLDQRQVLEVLARDDVGNELKTRLGPTLQLDSVTPSLDSGPPGTVVLHRVPWGDADGGPHFDVSGGAGAVDPGVVLRALDAAGVELGRATSTSAGFFISMGATDRRAIFLEAVDSACNRSALSRVAEVEWVATMGLKRVGSTFENPHVLTTFADFNARDGRLGEAAGLEVDATGLGAPGGAVLATPAQVRWRPDGPGARSGFSLAFDSTRRRTVLFGGVASSYQSDTWEWDGETWERTPAAGPPARFGAALTFDSARGVAVLQGGIFNLQDTWEWNGVSWVARVGAGPGVRDSHSTAYDPVRGKVVLFSGNNSAGGGTSDTWELDDAGWRLAASTGPAPRDQTELVYDSARRRVVLFGGQRTWGGQTIYGDLWEWDGTSWTQRIVPPGPSARYDHAMAYDESRQALLVHGGSGSGATTFNDTWVLQDGGWTRLATTEPMTGAKAVYDSHRQRVVLVAPSGRVLEWAGAGWDGGLTPACQNACAMATDPGRQRLVLLDDTRGTWQRTLTGWERMAVTGATDRRDHALAYAGPDAGVLVFGGSLSSGARLMDTASWDGTNAWVARADAGPPARSWHGMARDEVRSEVVLFGGFSSLSDTWTWDGSSWRLRATGGLPARDRFAMAYDANERAVVLFGGYGGGALGGTYAWNGASWVRQSGLEPSPRYGPSMAFDPERQRLVLFGGHDGTSALNETWVRTGGAWQQLSLPGATPAPRYQSPLAWDPISARLVLFEGNGASGGQVNDVWTFGLQPNQRPAQQLCFSFSAAGAGSSTVHSVELEWRAGGEGTSPGVDLWRRAGQRLAKVGSSPASASAAASAAPLRWQTSDRSTLDTLFEGAPQTVCFLVTPVGDNERASGALVASDYAELRVRYREP